MPDQVMPSRLELRLQSEISHAPTEVEADCKRAELAAYRARLGRLDEARGELVELRKRYIELPHVCISAWLHFAEGIWAYFESHGVVANDGIQRAYALSSSSGMSRLHCLSAAWLAQWAYTRLDIKSLAKYATEALTRADASDNSSKSRTCLVIAQALHMATRFDLSKYWYGRAREFAINDGDTVTVGAHLHNMAWLNMLSLRQSILEKKLSPSSKGGESALAESNESLNLIIGDRNWRNLAPLLRAQILSLQSRSAAALALYERHLGSTLIPSRWEANLLADKAWCLAALGRLESAHSCANLAIQGLSEETQVDDRAATYSRLGQIFSLLGLLEDADEYEKLAQKCWGKFAEIQAVSVSLLSPLTVEQ
jgi:tetratricopeptide (TPR) repeat protein